MFDLTSASIKASYDLTKDAGNWFIPAFILSTTCILGFAVLTIPPLTCLNALGILSFGIKDTVMYQKGIIDKLFVNLNPDKPGTEVTNTKIDLDFFLGRDTGYGRDAITQIVNNIKSERVTQERDATTQIINDIETERATQKDAPKSGR